MPVLGVDERRWIVAILPIAGAALLLSCSVTPDMGLGGRTLIGVGVAIATYFCAAGLGRLARRSRAWRILARTALLGSYVTLLPVALFVLVLRNDSEAQRFVLGASIGTDPGACPVPLRRIAACRREDRGWIECGLAYRAEGEPDEALCRRFLELSGPTPPSPRCEYTRTEGWVPIPCQRYGLELDRCFRCEYQEPEAHHELLQAFDATCTTSIVAGTCNDDLRRAVISLGPD